ncbi:MAG: sulfate ABC transporter permease, partial [Clostridium sp.]|nr:sulfate ABC transporter permease [Clostridium sp.]
MGIKNCTLKNKQKNNISLEKNNELIDHKIAYKKIDDTVNKNIIKKSKNSNNLTKNVLIGLSVLFIGIMLVMPMIVVISYALKNGINAYKDAVFDRYTIKAFKLTIITTITAVGINTFFGLFAAWSVSKFSFKGKHLLTTLIDIPFAIS